MEFTKQNVLNWMHDNIEQFLSVNTDDVYTTAMAEAAADSFEQAEQPGPLDDSDHWIWDAAHEVAEFIDKSRSEDDGCFMDSDD